MQWIVYLHFTDQGRFAQTAFRKPAFTRGPLSMPIDVIRCRASESYAAELNSWICKCFGEYRNRP